MFPFPSQPSPSPSPSPLPSPSRDSDELVWREVLADRLFQAICGAMGGLAAHSVRSAPQYFPLFIISCFAASGFLALVSPRDKTFLGLYRSSALILIIGALFPFWDLLMLIPQQILIGAVSAVFVGAIALIAILGRN